MFQSPRADEAGAHVTLQSLGLAPGDPVNRFVLQAFRERRRAGADIFDPEEQARCVAQGRADHKEWRIRQDAYERSCVVYYLKVNEYIKIGTAVDLQTRLAAYPPGTRVLATEPGSYGLESLRLREFGEYLVARREWFRPGSRLLAHIEGLQRAVLADAR
jgi:hypothetical protein